MPTFADVLQGTLDLLVLKALSLAAPRLGNEPAHPTAFGGRAPDRTRLALSRPLPTRGEKDSSRRMGRHENNREAKYYHLTAAGRRALAAESDDWRRFSSAVELVLSPRTDA